MIVDCSQESACPQSSSKLWSVWGTMSDYSELLPADIRYTVASNPIIISVMPCLEEIIVLQQLHARQGISQSCYFIFYHFKPSNLTLAFKTILALCNSESFDFIEWEFSIWKTDNRFASQSSYCVKTEETPILLTLTGGYRILWRCIIVSSCVLWPHVMSQHTV